MSNNNMKNADMPAMPQSFSMGEEDCGTVISHLSEADVPMNIGLTKREMFAKDADVSGYEIFGDDISIFLGREVDEENIIDMINASLEIKAKVQVMAADALLAELEK